METNRKIVDTHPDLFKIELETPMSPLSPKSPKKLDDEILFTPKLNESPFYIKNIPISPKKVYDEILFSPKPNESPFYQNKPVGDINEGLEPIPEKKEEDNIERMQINEKKDENKYIERMQKLEEYIKKKIMRIQKFPKAKLHSN